MKREYIKYGIAAAVILAVVLHPAPFLELLKKLAYAAAPVLWGIILAAVICPAVSSVENLLMGKGKRKSRISHHRARVISVALVYIIIVAAAAGIISIIIPRLAESVRLFMGSFNGYYSDFRRRSLAEGGAAGELAEKLDKLLESLSDRLPDIFSRTYTVTAEVIRSTANVIVGLVLSIYILASREQLCGFIKGAAEKLLSRKSFDRISYALRTFYGCLTNFIGGQLTEAVVLGTLCFAGMVIFGFEYPLLISTIIGVTALVPVAGAFAGAIPSALMLFLAKPSSALWFIVFIIVLQQLENNFIYPKIVGKSVGLPPILILTAIVIGAELGGAAGIMAGIPIVSAVYVMAAEAISKNAGDK